MCRVDLELFVWIGKYNLGDNYELFMQCTDIDDLF